MRKTLLVLLVCAICTVFCTCKPVAHAIEKPLYRNVAAIVASCEQYDFPIDWALAVFFTESSFNAAAITWEPAVKEDAVGMGQPLLSTAQYINPKTRKEDLLIPEFNADVCVYHLSSLLKKHCGDMESTLREYNGGNKWRKKKNQKYYVLVKKNRALILKQESFNEKNAIYNYYFTVCSELMYGRGRMD